MYSYEILEKFRKTQQFNKDSYFPSASEVSARLLISGNP